MAQYLYIWVRAYWFTVTSFSKWLPGGHIRFFGFWTAWFRQRNSSLLWNFSFKFHVHVLCGCRQKPNNCQLCRFQMAALWFWTMFNCNPPIAPCHPLLWGGGILVDHWSTISSCQLNPHQKLPTNLTQDNIFFFLSRKMEWKYSLLNDVTPLLTCWSYVFLALTHQYQLLMDLSV